MAGSKQAGSKGMKHHDMPLADFFQAYGKTLLKHNDAVAGYVARRFSDNMQTMFKMSVCLNPLEAATTMNEYLQRAGKDHAEFMGAVMETPAEVEQEVKDLVRDETEVLAKGKEDVFDNTPV